MKLFDDLTPHQHLLRLKYALLGIDFYSRQDSSDAVRVRNIRALLEDNRDYFDLSNYGSKDSIPERRQRDPKRNWATW